MTGEPEATVTVAPPETQPEKTGGISEAKFTQADLDRILSDRLRRAEESTLKKVLDGLGVENLDTAKAALKAHSESEASKKSELEKAAEKYAQLEKKHTELAAKLESELATRRKQQRNAAVSNALRDAKATDVDDLLVIVEAKYADALAGVLTEQDTIDDKALKNLLETVKKGHGKFFATQAPGSPSNRNGLSPIDSNPAAKLAKAFRPRF